MSTLNWAELVKDAGDAGTGGFQPVPAGEYDLKVLGVEVKQTQTEKTMFALKAEVQTGAYAKRLLWDNLVVSPENSNAMGFFFRKMRALGLDENFFATAPSDQQIASAMEGRSFKAKIKIGSYRGEPKNEFDTYAQAGAATPSFSAAPAPAAAPAPQAAPAPAPAAAPAPAPAAPVAAPAPAAPPAADPWANAPQAAPAAAPTGPAAPPAPPF